jgi:hypothetical protein
VLLSSSRLNQQERKGKEKKENTCFVSPLLMWVILIWILTSWPLLLVSLLTCLLSFLPNLRTELALSMSCSVVLLIGTVPSGHDSPDKPHDWKFSVTMLDGSWPLGLSGGSCKKLNTKHHVLVQLESKNFIKKNSKCMK